MGAPDQAKARTRKEAAEEAVQYRQKLLEAKMKRESELGKSQLEAKLAEAAHLRAEEAEAQRLEKQRQLLEASSIKQKTEIKDPKKIEKKNKKEKKEKKVKKMPRSSLKSQWREKKSRQ